MTEEAWKDRMLEQMRWQTTRQQEIAEQLKRLNDLLESLVQKEYPNDKV